MTDLTGYLTLLVYVVAILLATWFVAWLVGLAIHRSLSRSSPLVAAQGRRLGWIFVWVVGILLALAQLGVNTEILLLVLGLCGVAFLLATRQPLENFAARYFSDVYLPFKLGDTIEAAGHAGKVIEINAMTTLLLTPKDTLVSIPNATLMSGPVVNTTPQAWKELTVPIVIQSGADLAEFERTLLLSLNKLKSHLDDRFPPILSTRSRSPQSTELTLTLMIRDPGEREAIGAEVNQRVGDALKAMPSFRLPRAAETSPPAP